MTVTVETPPAARSTWTVSAREAGPQQLQPWEAIGKRRGGEVIMGKLLRVGGMRRCCSPAYTPRGYMLKGWRARPSRGAGRGHRAASSLSGGDSVRRRANTAPRPGPEEVAVRVPPWASINALEMVRPIPAPPLSRLRAAPPGRSVRRCLRAGQVGCPLR